MAFTARTRPEATRKRPVALTALIIVVAVIGLSVVVSSFRLSFRRGNSLQEMEVARTNLVLVSGRLCLVGQTNYFSGRMVEFSGDGSLRSRSEVANGLMNGLSLGYYTNGQVQVREMFLEGVSHGTRTKWYPSGARQSEAGIVNGKLHGTFRRWHENGKLAEQVEFVEGEPQGECVAYFPNGNLKARVTMQAGKIVAQNFFSDGQLQE
jgi:antitoxin component YwqK of YwqJK toxin-antitoxin module